MSMTINKELPNPAALKAEFPVPEHIKEIKAVPEGNNHCGGRTDTTVPDIPRGNDGWSSTLPETAALSGP